MITTVELMSMYGHAQSSDCTSTIVGLSSCLNYITGSTDTPSVPCCTQLVKVVQSAPRCLCTVLNGGASQFGVIINQTRALALPGACALPRSTPTDISS
ncbi:hypothetical protein KSP39_PZI000511 [Platanthera zijinensis]|uniref:Bifunctional inhibitor/plant lipid transfer protein/seed storage helical domain-containing protein n=1 Tax=Platanthera zijinensis TaxID=2320716 RepID=A0AAP0C280_9ASPA